MRARAFRGASRFEDIVANVCLGRSASERVRRVGQPSPEDVVFKMVGDGVTDHAVGDAVLRRVAEILTNRCRKTDVVARYGGEEFLLCFPDTNVAFAEQICTQIRSAVEREDWSDIGRNIRITISFGIAEIGNDSRRTTILNDADTRLYKAKKKGRNLVVV